MSFDAITYSEVGRSKLPVGAILTGIPNNKDWLPLNGQRLDPVAFPQLASLMGNTYNDVTLIKNIGDIVHDMPGGYIAIRRDGQEMIGRVNTVFGVSHINVDGSTWNVTEARSRALPIVHTMFKDATGGMYGQMPHAIHDVEKTIPLQTATINLANIGLPILPANQTNAKVSYGETLDHIVGYQNAMFTNDPNVDQAWPTRYSGMMWKVKADGTGYDTKVVARGGMTTLETGYNTVSSVRYLVTSKFDNRILVLSPSFMNTSYTNSGSMYSPDGGDNFYPVIHTGYTANVLGMERVDANGIYISVNGTPNVIRSAVTDITTPVNSSSIVTMAGTSSVVGIAGDAFNMIKKTSDGKVFIWESSKTNVYYTSNGTTWTKLLHGLSDDDIFNDIDIVNGVFVMMYLKRNGSAVPTEYSTSVDLSVWTPRQFPSGTYYYNRVVVDVMRNHGFIASTGTTMCVMDANPNNSYLWRTVDGINWTSHCYDPTNCPDLKWNDRNATQITHLVAAKGHFVVIHRAASINWQPQRYYSNISKDGKFWGFSLNAFTAGNAWRSSVGLASAEGISLMNSHQYATSGKTVQDADVRYVFNTHPSVLLGGVEQHVSVSHEGELLIPFVGLRHTIENNQVSAARFPTKVQDGVCYTFVRGNMFKVESNQKYTFMYSIGSQPPAAVSKATLFVHPSRHKSEMFSKPGFPTVLYDGEFASVVAPSTNPESTAINYKSGEWDSLFSLYNFETDLRISGWKQFATNVVANWVQQVHSGQTNELVYTAMSGSSSKDLASSTNHTYAILVDCNTTTKTLSYKVSEAAALLKCDTRISNSADYKWLRNAWWDGSQYVFVTGGVTGGTDRAGLVRNTSWPSTTAAPSVIVTNSSSRLGQRTILTQNVSNGSHLMFLDGSALGANDRLWFMSSGGTTFTLQTSGATTRPDSNFLAIGTVATTDSQGHTNKIFQNAIYGPGYVFAVHGCVAWNTSGSTWERTQTTRTDPIPPSTRIQSEWWARLRKSSEQDSGTDVMTWFSPMATFPCTTATNFALVENETRGAVDTTNLSCFVKCPTTDPTYMQNEVPVNRLTPSMPFNTYWQSTQYNKFLNDIGYCCILSNRHLSLLQVDRLLSSHVYAVTPNQQQSTLKDVTVNRSVGTTDPFTGGANRITAGLYTVDKSDTSLTLYDNSSKFTYALNKASPFEMLAGPHIIRTRQGFIGLNLTNQGAGTTSTGLVGYGLYYSSDGRDFDQVLFQDGEGILDSFVQCANNWDIVLVPIGRLDTSQNKRYWLITVDGGASWRQIYGDAPQAPYGVPRTTSMFNALQEPDGSIRIKHSYTLNGVATEAGRRMLIDNSFIKLPISSDRMIKVK